MRQWTRELRFWASVWDCSFYLRAVRSARGCRPGHHLPGRILKIPEHPGLKIPHMGWNSLKIRPEAKLFRGIEDGSYVYFVHSYYLKAEDESIVAASTEYSTVIHASVERENVFACQFHPEKSGEVGLAILKNFIGL